MTLAQLKYFLSVAETKSFTKAAEQNYTAQTTVSYSIKTLEEELGGLLFVRSTRAVELTEAGRWFYAEAKELVRHMELAKTQVSLLSHPSRELTIGYSSLVDANMLLSYIDRFRQRYPDVPLRLTRCDMTIKLYDELSNGTLDLAYFFKIPEFQPTNIREQIIGKASRYVIVPPTHRLAKKNWVTFEDLHNETILVYSKHTPDNGVEPFKNTKVVDTEDSESMEILISAHVGITVLPLSNGNKFRDMVKVPIRLDDSNSPDTADCVLAWHTSNKNPCIIDFLTEANLA